VPPDPLGVPAEPVPDAIVLVEEGSDELHAKTKANAKGATASRFIECLAQAKGSCDQLYPRAAFRARKAGER
jgi:hypothetical protein